MSLFDSLDTSDDIQKDKDTIGGNTLLDTGIYEATIMKAYAEKSKDGALGLFFTFKSSEGKEIRWNAYVTNKNGQNYYEKDGKKSYLPGFNLVNSLCIVAAGNELKKMTHEEKLVNVWDSDQKKETPQKKQVLVDLVGKKVKIGLFRQIENKQIKTDQGYKRTAETREVNDVNRFFSAHDKYENYTATEILAKEEKPAFYDKWVEAFAGKTQDRVKPAEVDAGAAGAPKAGGPSKPTESLFGDD